MSKNRYRKALRHIKSKKIDERLELLSEIPTNATSGVYVDTPGQFVQDPDVDNPQFSDHPLDLTQDDSARDTTGLFLSDGTILSAIPPGDNSYVLGPMMSMFYSFSGGFTQIGYVRQSDRKMTNLARISGSIDDWDGESGFTSYGQLTLEQAKWFRDQSKSTYFAFYPGAPASNADSEGRYEGQIVNSRRTYGTRTPDPRYVDSGSNRSGNPSDNYSAIANRPKTSGYITAHTPEGDVTVTIPAAIKLYDGGMGIRAVADSLFSPRTRSIGLARISARLSSSAGSASVARSRVRMGGGRGFSPTIPFRRSDRSSKKFGNFRSDVNPNQRSLEPAAATFFLGRSKSSGSTPRQSSMDIQVGDERITKKDGKTVTDTTRGIEDGKMDGKSTYTDDQGNMRVGEPTPTPTPTSQPTPTPSKSSIPRFYQNRSAAWMSGAIGASSIEDLTNEFRGTNVKVKFLKAQAQEAERASKTIARLGRRSSSLSNEKQIQQAMDIRDNALERIKAEIEGSKPDLKPIEDVPRASDNQAELERNIEASLKQLEIDNRELRGQALKRNIGFAIDLGLDILTVITLLSPIPGDEVAALSAQAAKVGLKTGVKTVAQKTTVKSLEKTLTSSKTLNAARDAIRKGGRNANITVKVNGKSFDLKAEHVLNRPSNYRPPSYSRGRGMGDRWEGPLMNSHQPQGNLLEDQTAQSTTTNTSDQTTSSTPEEQQQAEQVADEFSSEFAKTHSKDEVADVAMQAEEEAIYSAAQNSEIQRLLDKASKDGGASLTEEEKKLLIDNGYDDFVRGGMKGTDWLGDLLTLGISAAIAFGLLPLILKAGGSFVSLVRYEWGMRAVTDAAWKTFQTTGQMPPWYHWAFWKLLPQPVLNAMATMTGTTPATSLLYTQGTAAGKIGLHWFLKPALITSFFNALLKGDQRGAENVLRTSLTQSMTDLFEEQDYRFAWAMSYDIGESEFFDRFNRYGDKIPGYTEKNDRLQEISDPAYEQQFKDQIDTIKDEYEIWWEKGSDGKYYQKVNSRKDWGGQFTPQMFESSGQSFQEYEALRSQIGFFNNETGPNKYGQYQTLSYDKVLYAKRKGYKPEQFTGVAYEIVSRSYRMDELAEDPLFPKPGRNTYDNEEDFNKAKSLQEEYSKIFDEYVNLWEGPDGFMKLGEKAWEYWERSTELRQKDAEKKQAELDKLNDTLDSITDERNSLAKELGTLTDQILLDMLIDYLLEEPTERYPSNFNRPWNPPKLPSIKGPEIFGASETDAAVLAGRRRKKKKGQGGRSLGDTTERGGVQESKKYLTESHKKILREIKKPYKMPETPTKFKVSPKVIKGKNKVVGADMMKQQEIQKSFKPKPDNIWGKGEYAANVRASQEKKNTVLELLGAAEHHWTTLTEKSQREKQEKINEMMAAEYDREMEIMYEKYQKNQNKVDKIRSHYKDKPSPEGYPIKLPPETVDGYHPKYGKNYKYDKLDPHSAESMPKTGDQEIDANIDKATDHEKKDRKLKNLIGKVRKG